MFQANVYRSGLNSLVIFRHLLEDPVVEKLNTLLSTDPADISTFIHSYGAFIHSLYLHTDNFSRYLLDSILDDENPYVVRKGADMPVPEAMEECLKMELAFLGRLSSLSSGDLRGLCAYKGFLPSYRTERLDFTEQYMQRLSKIREKGYGVFAKYHVFTVDSTGALVPVKYPDPQRLSELTGYEKERAKLIANTDALLAGKPANNALLYGDAGTGKSSTVKAIANDYKEKGLRLIEVKKNQLYLIPDLVDRLSSNPCRFILFIDDLSFSSNDNDFSALKAILEGSVGGRSQNLVVYATSNRRHLVKETISDREGDDIHFFDTMQELMSLSARFGLAITFERPEKELYLSIVRALAAQYDLDMPDEELCQKAEAHAIRAGGRSPRTAKQFIELLKSGVVQ